MDDRELAKLTAQLKAFEDQLAIQQRDLKYKLETMDMHRMWQVGGEGNLDSTDPLTFKLHIPTNTKHIEAVTLWLTLKEFQAYSVSGSISSGSSTTSGAQWHSGVPDTDQPPLDQHDHDYDHSHDPVYAIFFTGMVGGVGVIINGVDVTAALGGPFNTDQSSLDITQYVQAIGANDVQLTCTSTRGRLQWGIFVEIYLP